MKQHMDYIHEYRELCQKYDILMRDAILLAEQANCDLKTAIIALYNYSGDVIDAILGLADTRKNQLQEEMLDASLQIRLKFGL